MNKAIGASVAACLLAGAALAHGGVRNAAVLARMEAMKTIGDATKSIGAMAKGETAFDAEQARAAAAVIAAASARTPALFHAPQTDPKSEALPAIWENWDDFETKAQALTDVANTLSASIAGPGDLRGAMAQLGGACKACHSVYRE